MPVWCEVAARVGEKPLADLDGAIHSFEQIKEVERLLQRSRRPELDRHSEEVGSSLFLVRECVAGDCDERNGRIDLDQFANGRNSVHARYEHIDHDSVD